MIGGCLRGRWKSYLIVWAVTTLAAVFAGVWSPVWSERARWLRPRDAANLTSAAMSALAAKAGEHAIGGRSDRRRLAEQLGPQTHGGGELAGDRGRTPSFGEERCEVARECGVVKDSLANVGVEPFGRRCRGRSSRLCARAGSVRGAPGGGGAARTRQWPIPYRVFPHGSGRYPRCSPVARSNSRTARPSARLSGRHLNPSC